jgi:hypothetical protein
MANGVSTAGLILDVLGAVTLANAVAFERGRDYVSGPGTGRWDYNAPADMGRATETAQAIVGLALLGAGFVFQGIAATGVESSPSSLLPYALALACVGVAAVVYPRERRRRESTIIRARVDAESRSESRSSRVLLWCHYAAALRERKHGPRSGETVAQWANRAYGQAFCASLSEPPPDAELLPAGHEALVRRRRTRARR